ncbi:MAG: hypothetical protein JXB00_15005 [Bacteroidales bacterium]|nr:hypothetical protein [Bacteroidales bacterium]
MTSDRNDNKIKAKELLEAFTVDTIVDHITDINNRINTLINCSSEDFLNLHSNFIKAHENIKRVVNDVSEILQSFSEEDNIMFINACDDVTNKFRTGIKKIIKSIQDSHDCQEEISRTLDYLYIPINNYNQNLKTYKLISANLKLDSNTIKYSNEINSIIEDIIEKYPDVVKNLNSLRKLLNGPDKTEEQFDPEVFRSVFETLDHIQNFGQYILRKHHQSIKLKQQLQVKINMSNESASKIITHLQYQDIVRQKIEHIHQTHQEILEKLSGLMENESHPDFILSKAKLLIQIRDITGLQAAQLIHANSEYQNAIEVITSRFIGLGEILHDIVAICTQFCVAEKSEKEHINHPEKIAEESSSLLKSLELFNDTFLEKPESVNKSIHRFSEKYTNLKNTGIQFNQLVNKVMQNASHANAGILGQMNEISAEFLKTLNQVAAYIAKTTEYSDKLGKIIDEDLAGEALEKEVISQCRRLISITDEFNRKKSTIFNKLNSQFNQFLVSGDIKESIESIKYYELFEKEIETIILNLDNISKKLHIEEEFLNNDDDETLESLKKRYTVKSEFIVHERISNEAQKGKTELFDKDQRIIPDETDEEDENLELF